MSKIFDDTEDQTYPSDLSVSEEELRRAIDAITRIIDVAKMKLDPKSECDMEIFRELKAHQYCNSTLLTDIYKSFSKQDKKKKKE